MYGVHVDLRPIECELRLVRLLLRTDVCLMSRSIEGRTPFLHNGIPDLALAIPWEELALGSGKGVLRRAYHSELGRRADIVKTRFRASDAMLRRCLQAPSAAKRLAVGLESVFGDSVTEQCLATLHTDAGFDADICCLLMSLAFLVEEGSLG